MKRRPIPLSLRFRVFVRDSFRCRYCGARAPFVVLHVDHRLAVALGGTDDFENLLTACSDCNFGKGARPIPITPRIDTDVIIALCAKDRSCDVCRRAIRPHNTIGFLDGVTLCGMCAAIINVEFVAEGKTPVEGLAELRRIKSIGPN
jgi:hypothetical protein